MLKRTCIFSLCSHVISARYIMYIYTVQMRVGRFVHLIYESQLHIRIEKLERVRFDTSKKRLIKIARFRRLFRIFYLSKDEPYNG